jgi:hypothetical protein
MILDAKHTSATVRSRLFRLRDAEPSIDSSAWVAPRLLRSSGMFVLVQGLAFGFTVSCEATPILVAI